MEPLHRMFADVTVRIITRYLVGGMVGAGLMTLATATEIVGSPQVQALISTIVAGGIAFAVEKATPKPPKA